MLRDAAGNGFADVELKEALEHAAISTEQEPTDGARP